ncbi:MAG: TolC family protein [Saprospiraceae bacterium]|nr:TolC family protein [Saprospiraceae bacterium]
MKTELLIIGLSLLTMSVINGQSSQDTLFLSDAVALAIENSHNIQIADLERQKAIFKQKENKSRLLPQVDAYSTFSYYYAIPKMVVPGEIFGQEGDIAFEFGTKYDWNTGLKFNQLIYSQSYFTSLELITEKIELQKLNIQLKKEEVAFQLSQLYYLCQIIDNQLIELDRALANLQKLKTIVELKKTNGMARQADVERLELDLSKVKIEKQQLAEHRMQQLNLLKLFIGRSIDSELLLAHSITSPLNDMVIAENTEYRRTELQLIDKQMQAATLETAIEKQSYLPVLAAFGQHYYQGMYNDFDSFYSHDEHFYKSGIIGLQLNIPIFDGFSRRNRIKMNEIEIAILQKQLEYTEILDANEKYEAWQNYHNCLKELKVINNNLKSAQRIYQSNLLAYQQQVIGLTDLILAENELTNTRIGYYSVLFKAISIDLKLKKIYGILLNNQF